MVTCWVVLGLVAYAVLSVALDLAMWGYRQERRKAIARDAVARRSAIPRGRGRGISGADVSGESDIE